MPADHKILPNSSTEPCRRLRDVLVPISLLQAPEKFGQNQEFDCLRGDLIVANGRVVGMDTADPTSSPQMLIPALVEAHCHLDKCHSINRLGKVGGDLSAALAAQKEDKSNWTAEDLRNRMSRGLSELAAAGCYAVRSHVDWGVEAAPPLAWSVLDELAHQTDDLTLQPAALIGIAQLADRQFCFDSAKHISAQKGAALGSFVLHQNTEQIVNGLRNAFAAADRFGLFLDFHVDEGLGEFNGLEMICAVALETGFQGPILCGHAVSLIDRKGDDLQRLLAKLQRANISICALPTTNLYLQGRRDETPDRRGLTRLSELHAADIPIIIASDNVGDAFCPFGQHDPRAALHLASLAAHLDPPMGNWLPSVTLNPARALGLNAPYIDQSPLRDLRLCDAANTADLVAGRTLLRPIAPSLEAPSL